MPLHPSLSLPHPPLPYTCNSLDEDYAALRSCVEAASAPGADPVAAWGNQLRRGGRPARRRTTHAAAHLLASLLCWDPRGRPTAEEARLHPFFTEEG